MLAGFSFWGLSTLLAQKSAPNVSTSKAYGQFSFAAPAGWHLDGDARMKHSYWLTSLRESQRRCLISVQSEGVRTLEETQSAKSIRFREILDSPTNPIIRRAKFRSGTGVLILKADVRYTPRTHPQVAVGVFHHIVYSFRGPDGRIYTFQCSTRTRDGQFFDRALDDLAKSINF
jgi:hypothetical protein